MNTFYGITLFALLSFGRLQASGGDIFARHNDSFSGFRSNYHCRIVHGDEVSCHCGDRCCSLLYKYNTMRNNRLLALRAEPFSSLDSYDKCLVVTSIFDTIQNRRSGRISSRL